jgi:protein SCO1
MAVPVLQSCNQSKAESSQELPFYISDDLTPHWISKTSDEYKHIHKIADFSFTDQNGNIVTNKTFKGKIYITDFFFTTCPGLCTNMTAVMQLLQKYFMNDSSVLLLSHTVTPKIDTVPILKKYAEAKHAIDGKWFMVTGNIKNIYDLARNSYFADGDFSLQKEGNTFLHSENFILVDQQGRIRGVYNGTLPAEMERLKEDVNILEKRI